MPTSVELQTGTLTVEEGPDRGRSARLDKRSLTIGTHEANDFVLTDATISRFHCRIDVDSAFVLRDLGSSNGTLLQNVRVREILLSDGTLITLGETRLRFRALPERVAIPLDGETFGGLRGRSVAMRELFAVLRRAARTEAPILLQGETGTGKELAARAIHEHSLRAGGPFVVFDCSAVADNLIESELFGHEKGAFTGAAGSREGVFERARGGTVFLDELGELEPDLQPKLLRVLEAREVQRLGGRKSIPVDVRVVAATNRDLLEEMSAGRFRPDLYHRLAVVQAILPPLRERREDIPMLAAHFARNLVFSGPGVNGGAAVEAGDEAAFESLVRYEWAGNVRELRNVVERAAIFYDHGTGGLDVIERLGKMRQAVALTLQKKAPLRAAREQFERQYLVDLLRSSEGNIQRAAEIAAVHPKSLERLIRRYKLSW
jgi:DNA-binding NtrC family response regulator